MLLVLLHFMPHMHQAKAAKAAAFPSIPCCSLPCSSCKDAVQKLLQATKKLQPKQLQSSKTRAAIQALKAAPLSLHVQPFSSPMCSPFPAPPSCIFPPKCACKAAAKLHFSAARSSTFLPHYSLHVPAKAAAPLAWFLLHSHLHIYIYILWLPCTKSCLTSFQKLAAKLLHIPRKLAAERTTFCFQFSLLLQPRPCSISSQE